MGLRNVLHYTPELSTNVHTFQEEGAIKLIMFSQVATKLCNPG